MRLKQYINMAVVAALAVGMTSCNDWLTDDTPGTNNRDEYFTSISTLENVTNACYVPLAWEYGDTYYSEWFFGDIASDDALKGGQGISDGGDAYDIDNFKVNTNNEIVLEYYRAQWQGIARCNLALDEIAKKKATSPRLPTCLRPTDLKARPTSCVLSIISGCCGFMAACLSSRRSSTAVRNGRSTALRLPRPSTSSCATCNRPTVSCGSRASTRPAIWAVPPRVLPKPCCLKPTFTMPTISRTIAM